MSRAGDDARAVGRSWCSGARRARRQPRVGPAWVLPRVARWATRWRAIGSNDASASGFAVARDRVSRPGACSSSLGGLLAVWSPGPSPRCSIGRWLRCWREPGSAVRDRVGAPVSAGALPTLGPSLSLPAELLTVRDRSDRASRNAEWLQVGLRSSVALCPVGPLRLGPRTPCRASDPRTSWIVTSC